jgi:hypothetical protein
MRRTFDIDVLACPRRAGRLRLIATVEDPDAIFARFCGGPNDCVYIFTSRDNPEH